MTPTSVKAATIAFVLGCSSCITAHALDEPKSWLDEHWLWTTASAIPEETTSEQSGYFSILEGRNGQLYIGTAKYGSNAFLVEFDPATRRMKVVVDAQEEIGTKLAGFAAQAKIHTRNNIGASGKIYFGTKQGYPKGDETRTDYPGGYPMVYDPITGKTRTYDIPIPHQGIISISPDESRDIAYVSTCSDERPVESTHFLMLDLKTGRYRDLVDCQHMYAFIVIDYLGRAYHPILGGEIARYDPGKDELERLRQTIDGLPPSGDTLLGHPESHPINWDVSPDRKTLYAVAMSGNQLYAYDLTKARDTIDGRRLGPLIAEAESTDCRAMCVGPNGTVWAGVAATFRGTGQFLHLVSYTPGDAAPIDHGPIAISNPEYTAFTDLRGDPKPFHHGVQRLEDGTLLPRYVIMGICATREGTVYVTTLAPFTVHAIRVPRVAGVTTTYHHNSHADLIFGRLLDTDTLDGKGKRATLNLSSLHADQVPENDLSLPISRSHGVPVFNDVSGALTQGTDRLNVDGVLLVAEHGNYAESDTGQFVYPKRRMFSEILSVFDKSGRVVPVFVDKHLADTWEDARWIYDSARKRNVPLMAGSSLPVLWRYPPADVPRGANLSQIVVVSYHRLDTYGFHALEVVQALAERRAGGETGVQAVQCLSGDDVWRSEGQTYDRRLLDAALSRLKERPIPGDKRIEDLVPEPTLFVIDYNDGLRACVFTLNPVVAEWAAAWSESENDRVDSTLFWTQEARPFGHFTYQLMGIEKMMQTREPTWPAERTLLTSGTLDALLTSKKQGGRPLQTPWLNVTYTTTWNWRQPPSPPPGRPIDQP
jgi:sugar lactone lactonase YvrE